jgi:tRNA (Thr-GGU) A37 N-methylase
MADFLVAPVAFVRGGRIEADDDRWGGCVQRIELDPALPDAALRGVQEFSHLEVLFLLDRVASIAVCTGTRRPRGNPAWPEVGVFAQRAKRRPNRLGSTIVRVLDVEPRAVVVAELDALDGTPVLDLKPVYREFLPRTRVRQPAWVSELMADYWTCPQCVDGDPNAPPARCGRRT